MSTPSSSMTSSSCLVSIPSIAELPIGSSSIHPLSHKELSSGGTSESHIPSDGVVRSLHEKRMYVRAQGNHYRHVISINVLPDDVFLEIFDLCRWDHFMMHKFGFVGNPLRQWNLLVHVCRRWRQVIFASPLRLDLRIYCTHGTPVRQRLDIWPTFPIVIGYGVEDSKSADEDNIIAALKHLSRVSEIRLQVTGPQLGNIVTAMQEPFPELTHLLLSTQHCDVQVLPSEFLGRSAPRLKELGLDGIPFPALPILLPSASDLVELTLLKIPQSGYISPETMVAALATLTRLEGLSIGFRSPDSRPDHILLPPASRTVLPALTSFTLRGVREYVEDFLARIDTPRLNGMKTQYFNQLFEFEVPQLSRFMDRSDTLKRPMSCSLYFSDVSVALWARFINHEPKSIHVYPGHMSIVIGCKGIDWQVSLLAQALTQISTVSTYPVHLSIDSTSSTPTLNPEDDTDDIEWVRLLCRFPSVKTLFVSNLFAGLVSNALEHIAAAPTITAEVLPALDILCLDGQPESSVEKFISVCQDSGRSVTFVSTESKFKERLRSYNRK